MPFYTPSPMVNFNYEPAKSDARRILDTQKEIKQEQQKDQEFEQKMKANQQAYELGQLKIQQAQVETDELLKQKRLDDLAAQTFQGIVASGGSKADGYKAVQELYLREGGWAAGQKAKEEAANAWKEAWDMADINPAAAEEAAELANSMAPAGSPRMTAQSIMEAKKRMKAEATKPMPGEKGDVHFLQPDGTWKTVNMLSDFTKKQMAEANALEQRKLQAELRRQDMTYAGQKLAADARMEVAALNFDKAILQEELRRTREGANIEAKGEQARKTETTKFENKKALLPLEQQNKLEQIRLTGEIRSGQIESIKTGQMDRELVKLAVKEKLQENDLAWKEKALGIVEAGKNSRSAEMAIIRRETNLLIKARDAVHERQADIKLKIAEKLAEGKLENDAEIRELKRKEYDEEVRMNNLNFDLDKFEAETRKALGVENLQQRQKEFDAKNQQGYFNRTPASGTASLRPGQMTTAYKVAAKDFDTLNSMRAKYVSREPNAIAQLLKDQGVTPTSDPKTNEEMATQGMKQFIQEKISIAETLKKDMTAAEQAAVDAQINAIRRLFNFNGIPTPAPGGGKSVYDYGFMQKRKQQ
jgi:hypothetical protein